MFPHYTQGGGIHTCLHIHEIIVDEYTQEMSSEWGWGLETLLFTLCPSGLLKYFHKYELLLKNNN